MASLFCSAAVAKALALQANVLIQAVAGCILLLLQVLIVIKRTESENGSKIQNKFSLKNEELALTELREADGPADLKRTIELFRLAEWSSTRAEAAD